MCRSKAYNNYIIIVIICLWCISSMQSLELPFLATLPKLYHNLDRNVNVLWPNLACHYLIITCKCSFECSDLNQINIVFAIPMEEWSQWHSAPISADLELSTKTNVDASSLDLLDWLFVWIPLRRSAWPIYEWMVTRSLLCTHYL